MLMQREPYSLSMTNPNLEVQGHHLGSETLSFHQLDSLLVSWWSPAQASHIVTHWYSINFLGLAGRFTNSLLLSSIATYLHAHPTPTHTQKDAVLVCTDLLILPSILYSFFVHFNQPY